MYYNIYAKISRSVRRQYSNVPLGKGRLIKYGNRFCSSSNRAISRTSVICLGTDIKGTDPLLS